MAQTGHYVGDRCGVEVCHVKTCVSHPLSGRYFHVLAIEKLMRRVCELLLDVGIFFLETLLTKHKFHHCAACPRMLFKFIFSSKTGEGEIYALLKVFLSDMLEIQ